MLADKTTQDDLSIFNAVEEHSIFHYINFTLTSGGKEWLRKFVSNPFNNKKDIEEVQAIVQRMQPVAEKFRSTKITNGTLMVLHTFFETAVQDIAAHPGFFSSLSYRIFNSGDFSFVRYSIGHFIDFFTGMQQVHDLLYDEKNPAQIKVLLQRIQQLLQKPALQKIATADKKKMTIPALLELAAFLKRFYKREIKELIELYSQCDAWYSMATACTQHRLCFPVFEDDNGPLFRAAQLYHPMLAGAVSYDITLTRQKNFLFITGANMGGKSTFIKAAGVAVYLAHIGMGVPAASMQLSVFDGLLSNINIEDNLAKGESYFYNEVQRIKATVSKLLDGKKWLILIDELFKGTNVEDAMKCSTVVIEGMLKDRNALFILSTHLYEIGEPLKQYPNIIFKYFETTVSNGQLQFNYTLKDGISNDRLGYLILKREGVVDLLEKL